ncbi:MAG: class I SAM-dependent methyltransferase [Chitinophagales bacterium]|nr:class I SAM-dependent methyltransferase [Chitinophagales bacterium]
MNLIKKSFQFKEYALHLINAKSIHSIHSPFVFDFVKNVLYDYRNFYVYNEIERLRKELLAFSQKISIEPPEFHTPYTNNITKSIAEIIKASAKPPRQAQLLFRIANHYGCKKMLELGTSFGFTSCYLSGAGKESYVITLEGNKAVCAFAQKNFTRLNRKNIELICGAFNETLKGALQKLNLVDLIFFDGDHRKSLTIDYFVESLPYLHENSILIFDDIHWSKGMNEAWEIIKSYERVTLTIDLYYFGIVFFRKALSKQHYIIKI